MSDFTNNSKRIAEAAIMEEAETEASASNSSPKRTRTAVGEEFIHSPSAAADHDQLSGNQNSVSGDSQTKNNSSDDEFVSSFGLLSSGTSTGDASVHGALNDQDVANVDVNSEAEDSSAVGNGDENDGFRTPPRRENWPLRMPEIRSVRRSRPMAVRLRTWTPVTAQEVQAVEEMEEYFDDTEKKAQQEFMEKYNFDVVNDVPLEGRYQWVRIKPN